MIKVDILSGFLGAGKTTLIKKLIDQAFKGEKLVLIENEFGEIGIDGGFLKDAGVEITEMNSGCICCTLVGDFGEALKKVAEQFTPDRVIIEPSGVGKLSDVIKAVTDVQEQAGVVINSATTVVDVKKCKMYMKNFGEFFNNQIESAGTIVLSRTQEVSEAKINEAVAMIKEHNAAAQIITTPWEQIEGKVILDAMEGCNTLDDFIKEAIEIAKKHQEEHEHEHHHHDHDEDGHEHHHHHDHDEEEHEHHHHHDHDEDEHEHHHHHDHDEDEHEHHHHHDHDEDEHEHHHHHDHDDHDHDHHEHHYDENGVCSCGHHHHDHDGHHHADDVFTSWGVETAKKYSEEELKDILQELSQDAVSYGIILRAKGMVPDESGVWHQFDLVPGDYEVRVGSADVTGKLCVIGSQLKEDAIKELFKL